VPFDAVSYALGKRALLRAIGAEALPKLSGLEIDSDKDWAKKNITNFGPTGIDLHGMVTSHGTRHKQGGADEVVGIALQGTTLPSAGVAGRFFIKTDTLELYYDNGTAWVLIGKLAGLDLSAHASRHAAGGADAIPAGGISRSMLEYPTVNVTLPYLAAIGKLMMVNWYGTFYADLGLVTVDTFTDKQVYTFITDHKQMPMVRYVDLSNSYWAELSSPLTTQDWILYKIVAGAVTALAYEAVDIVAGDSGIGYLQVSGSSLRATCSGRATLTATDTSLASGSMGLLLATRYTTYYGGFSTTYAELKAPASPAPTPLSIIETEIAGSGKPEDPFRPKMLSEVVVRPDANPRYYRRYTVLKAKGFTDEEIEEFMALGHELDVIKADVHAVTVGTFEFHPDKAPTVTVMIMGDNPYKPGAIERQKAKAKRVFAPPTTYDDAVSLYNTLKKDYPHWLAGKDNFAYQTLGLEIFDWMQNIDFYYGELIEHKTHYGQLKQVPDFEIRNRLNELIDKLSKVTVLVDERDKHINKAREVLRRGW
jgi:hypothetical protein